MSLHSGAGLLAAYLVFGKRLLLDLTVFSTL